MGYITKRTKFELTHLNKKKLVWLVVSAVLCLLGCLLVILINPLTVLINYYSQVANGSYVHELLQREIKGIHLSAYLFNITNHKEFISGKDHKLKVKEIGPYTYEEVRVNEQMEIDPVAEVLRYTPRIKAVFLPEESVGRPEDFNITMPNIALLSMASKMSVYPYLPRMAFNLLTYQYMSKPVVSMSVHDYLWGYDEPLIKLGNNVIPGIIDFDTLGLLDRLYDKKAQYTFELSTKKEDKFSIKSVNGVGGLKMWQYEDPEKRSSCNSFRNSYEGIAYPPLLKPDKPLKIYRSILCRFLELEFLEQRTMEYGAEGLFYKISNKTFTVSNDTACLCSKGICAEGISDMSPCFLGLPIVLSNAHFLYADPKLYERVEGMTPNQEEHDSGFTIDPITGVVLTTQFSVQVNILVRDVKYISEASKFSDMLVPVGYFKVVQPPLLPDQIFELRFVYIYGPYAVLVLRILLFVVGLILLALAARIIYGSWSYEKTIAFHIIVKETPSSEQPLMT